MNGAAQQLWTAAGFTGKVTLEPISGGANNRVYRATAGDACALLKAYFRHPQDQRDRLGAEYAFAEFAWAHGVRQAPKPLACDRAEGLALYEYIPGKRLEPGEVDDASVQQALDFVRALNAHRTAPDALALPAGSEACFSVADHLACVTRRVERLRALQSESDIDREAAAFVNDMLLPRWQAISAEVEYQADAVLTVEIPHAARCLSPSDFGFHNAILPADGCLRFIDFEYAGWDDPAKLVCDFFCQPAVPVPLTYFTDFTHRVVALLSLPAGESARYALLLPVYQVKWCCIILNAFLPVGGSRRDFAHGPQDIQAARRQQLAKAERVLEGIQPQYC